MTGLALCPVTRDDADRFVEQYHRHSRRPRGYRFALGVELDGEIVGVAIVGRPIARHLDDGWTLEALRVCTDGTRNACSFLYGASWRAARALGYRRLVSYTLASESGSSLRGAGWRVVGNVRAEAWHREARPRVERPGQERLRWEATT